METKDWVLLIKNQTHGPYTRNEVEQLLSSGEARYSDHVWSARLTKWYPIHNLAQVDWDLNNLENPIAAETVSEPIDDLLSEVVLHPRKQPSLGFDENEPAEATTEDLASSPMKALIDEIIWDEPIQKIHPEKKTSIAYAPRLLHLTRTFGFSIRNTEKSFLLGWFFVISGLLCLWIFFFRFLF